MTQDRRRRAVSGDPNAARTIALKSRAAPCRRSATLTASLIAQGTCGWRIGKFWRESPLWCSLVQIGRRDNFPTHARVAPPGDPSARYPREIPRPGRRAPVAAESLLLKHQLLINNRSRQRAPNLTTLDRLVLGLTTLFVSPHRIPKLSASLKPATLFKFHQALVHRKYRLLFSSSCRRRKPGPKGPSATHRGHRRDEAPQSEVRLCPHRPADRSRLCSPLESMTCVHSQVASLLEAISHPNSRNLHDQSLPRTCALA
jgi:hypothetical protein